MCCLWLLGALRVCPLCSPCKSTPGGCSCSTGNTLAPASSLCPLLIPPGSPWLRWLPAQFGDFSSEKRPPYRPGRAFLGPVLGSCWHRVHTSALGRRVLCLQGRDFCWSTEHPMAPWNQPGLVGWMFCLITGIYLKVLECAGLSPVQTHRFPQIFNAGYLSLL